MKKYINCKIPMKLQFFAEPGGEGGNEPPQPGGQQQNQQTPAVDYEKIQRMLEGTLAAKEETAQKAMVESAATMAAVKMRKTPICLKCAHLEKRMKCSEYRKGIPTEILSAQKKSRAICKNYKRASNYHSAILVQFFKTMFLISLYLA